MKIIKDAFTHVYSNKLWGSAESISDRKNKKFYSGGGTNRCNDKNDNYVNLIQSYVNSNEVKTVVEIGCGDWEVSSRIDWSLVNYTGYDVVEELIEYNIQNYSKENIIFICDSNVIIDNNLTADLLIVKDVFQHLPPKFCVNFIKDITKNFKYNIITNDYSVSNFDIEFGGYYGNNFSADPFNMRWELLIEWEQLFKEAGKKITLTFV